MLMVCKSLVLCCVCGSICCLRFRNNLLFAYEAAVPIFIIIIWFKSDVLFPIAKLCIESHLDNATHSNPGGVLVCSVGRLTINFSNALSCFIVVLWLLWTESTTQNQIGSAQMEQHFFLTSLCHIWYWYTCWQHSWNGRADTSNFGGREVIPPTHNRT